MSLKRENFHKHLDGEILENSLFSMDTLFYMRKRLYLFFKTMIKDDPEKH